MMYNFYQTIYFSASVEGSSNTETTLGSSQKNNPEHHT